MIRKVAIVDDDSIFQFTTKVTIQRLKLAETVEFFQDGSEMMEFLRSAKSDEFPEVVLLDINMPVTDGWDFLDLYNEWEEEKQKQIRIYMLSSSINPVDINKAEENKHVLEYVIKPISDDILSRILA